MHLDSQTCRSLHIFSESVDVEGVKSDSYCLFGQFKLQTYIGKRMLKRRLYSPSSDGRKIKKWQDYLETLLNLDEQELERLRTGLGNICSIDVAFS
jgi:DNA mismatch repair ATPase MutS